MRLYAGTHEGAPSPTIYSVNLPDLQTRWLSKPEAGRLLAAAISSHVGLFILLMLATAARPEALFDLRWSQIDFRAGLIRLNPRGRPKTAKHRPIVKITSQLMQALPAAYAKRTCDYVIEYGGHPLGSIKRAFREAAKRAGFARGEVTPYTLRHTAATWMA